MLTTPVGKSKYDKDLPQLDRKSIQVRYDKRLSHRTDPPVYRRNVVVTLTTPQGSFEGYSECSELDNFNRKIGRNIAYGRAVKHWWKAWMDC